MSGTIVSNFTEMLLNMPAQSTDPFLADGHEYEHAAGSAADYIRAYQKDAESGTKMDPAFTPVKKNTDDNFELNDCDSNGDPKVYQVFRESNQRRDEWRTAVLSGPRKDKSQHELSFFLSDVESNLERRLQQCSTEKWFSQSDLIKAYLQAAE